MALAETANLLVNLSLKGNFNQQLTKTQRALNTFDRRLDRSESRAFRFGQQIGTGIRRSAALAAGGLAFLALNVEQGLDSLIKLEAQTAQTNAAIKSTGKASRVSAAGVRRLAEEFESLNAVFGDEVIQAGENLLLTFKNIRGKAFRPTLQAALDLAVGLGVGPEGLTQTILKLGKALDDPVKGLTALGRAGVKFDAAQIKRIKALVKAGKLRAAQAIILGEIERKFGGRFVAQGKTTEGQIANIKDAVEDLQRALAEALLPTLNNVATALSKALRDPAVVASVREFGQELAQIFSKENLARAADTIGGVVRTIKAALPAISGGLSLAASVIGGVVTAFSKLPPEVQQLAVGALLANKLTGGAVTTIIGGIAGLFKNFVAAGVNIEAGVVNVAGGIGGPGAPVPGGKPTPAKPITGAAAPAIGAGIILSQEDLAAGVAFGLKRLNLDDASRNLNSAAGKLSTSATNLAHPANLPPGHEQAGGVALVQDDIRETNRIARATQTSVDMSGATISSAVTQSGFSVHDAVVSESGTTRSTISGSSDRNAIITAGATAASAASIVSAIWAARPIVNVTNVTKSTTILQRYGPGNGSYGGGPGK